MASTTGGRLEESCWIRRRTRFFCLLTSTIAATLVLSTCTRHTPRVSPALLALLLRPHDLSAPLRPRGMMGNVRLLCPVACVEGGASYLGDDAGGDGGLDDDGLAAALDPVDGRGLLVGAQVAADRDELQRREPALQQLHHLSRGQGRSEAASGGAFGNIWVEGVP